MKILSAELLNIKKLTYLLNYYNIRYIFKWLFHIIYDKDMLKSKMMVLLLISIVTINISISSSGLKVNNNSAKNITNNNYDIIVDDDGPADFDNIQDAIDSASSKDTIFVKNGYYKENLVVEKSITLLGENKTATIVDGGIKKTLFRRQSTVVMVKTDNVKISNFTFQNATGIDGRGVYFYKNKGADLTHDNNFSDNIIKDCSYGLMIVNPINNTVTNNSFFNCNGGYHFTKLPSHENVFFNNTVNNRPILHFEGQENLVIEGDIGCVGILDCKNITIKNITTSNLTVGIDISYSTNITVYNCTISNTNRGGIYVHYSEKCKFFKNTFKNDNWGIFLRSSNNNKILHNNFIKITKHDWFGSSYKNKWYGNYWGRPMFRPKFIYGKIGFFEKIPWFNIDSCPARQLN